MAQMNRVQFQKAISMDQFLARYGTQEQCEDALEKIRWRHGYVCPIPSTSVLEKWAWVRPQTGRWLKQANKCASIGKCCQRELIRSRNAKHRRQPTCRPQSSAAHSSNAPGEYFALHEKGWKNAKHAAQWINTLAAYAFPIFGAKDVSEVSKADIMRALEPIWATKTETASRLTQRIRAVLDWVAARDYRTGHDPQIWDQIARSLPKSEDIKKSLHFASCRYTSVHDTLQSIKQAAPPSQPSWPLNSSY